MNVMEHLESFGGKERLMPLRESSGRETVRLDPRFAGELGRLLGLSISVDALVAIVCP